MELVSAKEKRKYGRSTKRTMPMIITCSIIFLLVGIVLGSNGVTYGNGEFWSRIDGTLVLTNV
ncbi:unnamed protein product, partial [marine sediment metagenome]